MYWVVYSERGSKTPGRLLFPLSPCTQGKKKDPFAAYSVGRAWRVCPTFSGPIRFSRQDVDSCRSAREVERDQALDLRCHGDLRTGAGRQVPGAPRLLHVDFGKTRLADQGVGTLGQGAKAGAVIGNVRQVGRIDQAACRFVFQQLGV